MARQNLFTVEVSILVNGAEVPYMEIDADGSIRQHISDEKREEYKAAMLKNMGECMSAYYTINPERYKGI